MRQLKSILRLTKTYCKHADRLQKTGEGVDDGEQESQEKVLDFYIPGSGPTESTPAFAVNLWGKFTVVENMTLDYLQHEHLQRKSRRSFHSFPICMLSLQDSQMLLPSV